MIFKTDVLAAKLADTDATDPLVITPTPDLDALSKSGSAAVDLRLGTWFVSLRQARMPYLEIGRQRPTRQFTKTHYVAFGDNYILHPQSFVLGATFEWIRVPTDMAAYVVGKSGLGRCGLIIATATGVHPGFKGCLTLEITNVGSIPIAISPGIKICQLFFHQVKSMDTGLVDRSQFVGLRRPRVGRVDWDETVERMAQGYRGRPESAT